MRQLVAALRGCVGASNVLTEPSAVAPHCVDWTRRWQGGTPAVVLPGTVDEVAAVVAVCRDARAPIVPQGGNTGLVGGSVPLGGEVVVSTRRLDALGAVDIAGGRVSAGAGVTLDHLHGAAARAGLLFPIDLGARTAATVGGMVATNAGGVHVVRYGTMRAQLLGIEAVLGDGTVVSHLRGLRKDNTGYDLAALLCGSEGTLGIVTAAELRLLPRPRHRIAAIVGFASVGDAVVAAGDLLASVDGVEALELMLGAGVALVEDRLERRAPESAQAPASLLVECAGMHDPTAHLAAAVDALRGRVGEPSAATDDAARQRLWQIREGHPEAAATMGVVHKLDVTLPTTQIDSFVAEVERVVRELLPHATCLVYGHVGDGNLHVNVVGGGTETAGDALDDRILELVDRRGGSISAEHGIGVHKRRWLARTRHPGDLAAFHAIKHALDPAKIMNPNVLLP